MTQVKKIQNTKNIRIKYLAGMAFLTASLLLGSSAQAMNESKMKHSEAECKTMEPKEHDSWIQGKLEGAYFLNKHLNPMEIKTKVNNNIVFLSGNVDSDIEKDLAGEIAKSIEGVEDVKNGLTVRPENFKKGDRKSTKDQTNKNGERGFVQQVEDASTTASVKVQLLANSNTDGTDINVDTMNNIVTLKGHVNSPEEKDLAEKIALNTDDVLNVVNKIKVNSSKE